MRFEETRGQPDPFVAEPDQSQASEFPQRDEWMRENSPVGEDTRDMYRQYDRGEKPYRVGVRQIRLLRCRRRAHPRRLSGSSPARCHCPLRRRALRPTLAPAAVYLHGALGSCFTREETQYLNMSEAQEAAGMLLTWRLTARPIRLSRFWRWTTPRERSALWPSSRDTGIRSRLFANFATRD